MSTDDKSRKLEIKQEIGRLVEEYAGICDLERLGYESPLAESIPFKGALGLRRLDEATTASVWAQIGETDDLD